LMPHVFIVHEWLSTEQDSYEIDIRNTLFDVMALTITAVDWNEATEVSSYDQAIADSQTIAKEISLIARKILNTYDIQYSQLCCMGIGLGGQICGLAGNFKKLGYIMAWDPVAPGFEQRTPAGRLNSNSADVVEVHHSASLDDKNIGLREPCGHRDYYINGGGDQPECQQHEFYSGPFSANFGWKNNSALLSDLFGDDRNQCSHFSAARMWMESERSGRCISRQKCTKYKNIPDSCDPPSPEPLGIFGQIIANPGNGNLYITTNPFAPYCKG